MQSEKICPEASGCNYSILHWRKLKIDSDLRFNFGRAVVQHVRLEPPLFYGTDRRID